MIEEKAFNWQISGHSRQLELLSKALTSERLAHAYVFAGPESVGKKTVARRLAEHLLCEFSNACGQCGQCKTLSAGSNPDYIEILSEDVIKIEAVRDLSYKLSLKPYSGKKKFAVIDNAHLLTTEAANSLLKILEEPKDHTIMVLVTSSPHSLLPTITSRAQKINFGPLPDHNFVSDSEKAQNQLRQEWFEQFQTQPLGRRLVLATELAEQETPDLLKTINFWLKSLQTELRQDPTSELVKKIKEVSKIYRLIQQNVNTKLALTNLMAST
jgi:DNA polymerase III delta' subunit